MRLMFMGSPSVAVPFLEVCVASGHEVAAVVTQPDKPSGRGLELKAPPVKEAALRLGLKVLQPEKASAAAAELAALRADMAVVVAYGKMLKPELLEATRLGCLNVHFSLLPKYRGAAPVQWALMRGETETGVTLFWIVQAMDAGPVQRMARCPIDPEDDAAALFEKLVALGAAELEAALAEISEGRVLRRPQVGEPTFAPKLSAETARIDFDMPAAEIHDRVRGLTAGPGAWFESGGRRVKLVRTALADAMTAAVPGRLSVVEPDGAVLIECGPGILRVREVQPEGKRKVSAADFVNGLRLKAGQQLWSRKG